MNCREFADFLDDYLSGRLTVAEAAEFDRHLAECDDCVAYMQTYRATIDLSRTAFADGSAPAEAPAQLIRAILALCPAPDPFPQFA